MSPRERGCSFLWEANKVCSSGMHTNDKASCELNSPLNHFKYYVRFVNWQFVHMYLPLFLFNDLRISKLSF